MAIPSVHFCVARSGLQGSEDGSAVEVAIERFCTCVTCVLFASRARRSKSSHAMDLKADFLGLVRNESDLRDGVMTTGFEPSRPPCRLESDSRTLPTSPLLSVLILVAWVTRSVHDGGGRCVSAALAASHRIGERPFHAQRRLSPSFVAFWPSWACSCREKRSRNP